MGSDPIETVTDVGLNFVTGGLYSVAKAAKKTVDTGDLSHLMTQGFDVGLAAVGNELAVAIGGQKAGMAFNAAGAALGALGAAGAFASLPGFTAGGVAPLAAAPSGAIPLASGVAPTTAEVAGASLTGPVSGVISAPAAASVAGQGGLASLAGLPPVASAGGLTGLSAAAPTVAPQVANSARDAFTNSVSRGTGTISLTQEQFDALNKTAPGGMSDMLATMGIMTGGQMITGSLGGLFQGLSMEKQLELQKLIADRTEAQAQFKRTNSAFAPLVQFQPPPSLANG